VTVDGKPGYLFQIQVGTNGNFLETAAQLAHAREMFQIICPDVGESPELGDGGIRVLDLLEGDFEREGGAIVRQKDSGRS